MGGGRNLTHVEVPVLSDVGSLTPVAADLHPSQILGRKANASTRASKEEWVGVCCGLT
jgi:hypothetical protein